MKKTAAIYAVTIAISFCTYCLHAASAQAQQPKAAAKKSPLAGTFTGVISDGQCALKGSHKEVMKKASVNTEANCTKGCARRYGYVLYDPASRKVYKLADQERAADFPAKRVKVTGRLDKSTQTIYVSKIEAAK